MSDTNARIELEARYLHAAGEKLDAMTPEDRAPWLQRARVELDDLGPSALVVADMMGRSLADAVEDQARIVYLREVMYVDLTRNKLVYADDEGREQRVYSWTCSCVDCRRNFPSMEFRRVNAESLARAVVVSAQSSATTKAGEFARSASAPPPDWRAEADKDPRF